VASLLTAHVHAAAQAVSTTGDWIILAVVAETSGAPAKWLGESGFEFADAARAAAKDAVVPKVGDRIRLTTVKAIRRTNDQGRPFERANTNFDTAGELAPGTLLKVVEIGKRPTSKAGDRWECWVRVER
jgi:hypothetical protein